MKALCNLYLQHNDTASLYLYMDLIPAQVHHYMKAFDLLHRRKSFGQLDNQDQMLIRQPYNQFLSKRWDPRQGHTTDFDFQSLIAHR